MKEFEAAATIQASPERVWEIITDGKAYPEFDPSCERVEGEIAVGNKIKVFSHLSPGRAFPVKVVEMDEARRMTWQGGMPLGLFRGVRTFTLSPRPDGATDFRLREVFSGPMLPLISGSLPDMNEAFQGFCEGLKRRAESVGG